MLNTMFDVIIFIFANYTEKQKFVPKHDLILCGWTRHFLHYYRVHSHEI
jgi:hypothetical protein